MNAKVAANAERVIALVTGCIQLKNPIPSYHIEEAENRIRIKKREPQLLETR